jgi:CRISPR-associated exonuclease Cas4
MFTEDDLLPISALAHLEFCPRRCGLIHVEGIWTENAVTAEGRVLHSRVHEGTSENIAGVRVVRGLRLHSLELGLYGIADIVEFHPLEPPETGGIVLPDREGYWRPYPVEYKRGKKKKEISYFVQLCAQALCLEEMLSTRLTAGALYHGKSRKRQEVPFDESLRDRTRKRIVELHEMVASSHVPQAKYGPKCKFCSLLDKCVPKLSPTQSARTYLSHAIDDILAE